MLDRHRDRETNAFPFPNNTIKTAVSVVLCLRVCTYVQDGDRFWRMPECYIRGSTIKYLRIPDEIIDMVKEEVMPKSRGRGEMRGRGGSCAARGRGTPGRGGETDGFITVRHSYASAVLGVVIPPVCLSHVCFVMKLSLIHI